MHSFTVPFRLFLAVVVVVVIAIINVVFSKMFSAFYTSYELFHVLVMHMSRLSIKYTFLYFFFLSAKTFDVRPHLTGATHCFARSS